VESRKTHFALSEESVLWAGIGAVLGAMLVPVPWALGLVMGGGVGWALEAGLRRRARARRRRQLGFELPAIADLLGLYVLSGESVLGAMRRVRAEASGVAATLPACRHIPTVPVSTNFWPRPTAVVPVS
jgi:Flp pilus assembly protein TadB